MRPFILDPGPGLTYAHHMYVTKFPSPDNYRPVGMSEDGSESSWYRRDDNILALTIRNQRWDADDGLLDFSPEGRQEYRMVEPSDAPEPAVSDPDAPEPTASDPQAPEAAPLSTGAPKPDGGGEVLPGIYPSHTGDGGVAINWNGEALLQTTGLSIGGPEGRSWILSFHHNPDYSFYGLGEKNGSLEHSGRQTTFWNTDVMGDFPGEWITEGLPDPLYISIPYVLIRCDKTRWIGVFSDNMYRSHMSLGANPHIELIEHRDVPAQFFIAAEDGTPRLHFIAGDSPSQVTRSVYRLLGRHERPPLWSLGHHQSRWGYASRDDLLAVRHGYAEHKIPNDGLWLDIDYMDGYRVFTFNSDHFPSVQSDLETIQAEGQYVIPILDPGVKRDPAYAVYNEGHEQGYFCRNSAGGEYVGYVWPGETVFPDFSLETVRRWWASHVARLIRLGIRGFWVDMNEPATGSADPMEMRFRNGSMPHGYFHNSYALGMQQATHLGFQNAAPDLRPFILSRAGSPGTSRYAAVWLGDSVSNYHHLAQALVTGMNLGLSGIAIWGADVPGFAGDADGQLALDWYKSAFLQPFLRNHSCLGTADQEPWQFGSSVRRAITRYIRLRYRFLPYLYNLHILQEERGEPLLTPLWYHFPEVWSECPNTSDQFMVGSGVMQAPFVQAEQQKRDVYLPPGGWYDAAEGRWRSGGRNIVCERDHTATPLFFREHSAIVLQAGTRKSNKNDLSNIEIHVILRKKSKGSVKGRYVSDDGLTRGYTRGNETRVEYTLKARGDSLDVTLEHRLQGHGPLRIALVLYDDFESVILNSSSGKLHNKKPAVKEIRENYVGSDLSLRRTKSFLFILR